MSKALTYEQFKELADEIFKYYGVEMEFLKTGTANPKYRLVVKGYKVERIKNYGEFNPVSVARKAAICKHKIPKEIREVAFDVIHGIYALPDNKNKRTHNRDVFYVGTEGVSGTDWISACSIRMPTSEWNEFAKIMKEKMNYKKNIDLIRSL